MLVQMPLWQRSSSLHSSTSEGQRWKSGPLPSLLNLPGHAPPLLFSRPSGFKAFTSSLHLP